MESNVSFRVEPYDTVMETIEAHGTYRTILAMAIYLQAKGDKLYLDLHDCSPESSGTYHSYAEQLYTLAMDYRDLG